MSLEKKLIFLSAFAQFPDYNFLWKYEKPIVDFELPKNVFIRPWLPQSDILNHTKVKAFITHSGKGYLCFCCESTIFDFFFCTSTGSLSTFESIWRGVPMVGVPFAFDQHGVMSTYSLRFPLIGIPLFTEHFKVHRERCWRASRFYHTINKNGCRHPAKGS